MALNDNYNIANLPTLDIPRSKFTKNHQHITTFNVGDLVPIFVDELLPGTTVNLRTNCLVRLQTLLNPIFSNIYMDVYYFFVPSRLLWTHWREFMGENTSGAWTPQVTYSIPKINSGASGFPAKSIADHLGVPTDVGDLEVNALPFRAVGLIWNEYFRDQNLSDPINIYLGDDTIDIDDVDMSTYVNYGDKGLTMLKVAKYKDLFTTALPAPQKGAAVSLGLEPATAFAFGGQEDSPYFNRSIPVFSYGNGSTSIHSGDNNIKFNSLGSANFKLVGINDQLLTPSTETSANTPLEGAFYPLNLYASVDNEFLDYGLTVNNLRLAFATQKLLERDARYGTRYTEILQGHFGVNSGDARLQRPEFFGGDHFNLNIDQVVETAGTTENSVLGETGAYSLSANSSDDVSSYSALEHGYFLGFACARYEHSYPQGLDKMWSRTNRLDFYWPELSNIGEVGITNKEIFCADINAGETAEDTDRENIFGYQEAWYEYRTKKSYVSAEMRSNYTTPLDSWHLADDYDRTPILGDSWIKEDGDIVNRVLAVSNNVSDQIFADFFFEYDYVAPLPVYSTPGLVDIR